MSPKRWWSSADSEKEAWEKAEVGASVLRAMGLVPKWLMSVEKNKNKKWWDIFVESDDDE